MKYFSESVLVRIYTSLRGIFSVTRRYQRKFIRDWVQNFPEGSLILDIGVGFPLYRSIFKKYRYVSLDIDLEGRPSVLGSIYALPFKDNTFDICLCTEVLEHLPEPSPALSEMRRVLSDSGQLILTVPFVFGVHSAFDYHRWTKMGLTDLLKKGGFIIVQIKERGGIFSVLAQLLHLMGDTFANTVFPSRPHKTHPVNWPRYAFRLLFRACLAPLTQLLLAIDFIDRRKDSTTGYAVLSNKAQPLP